MRNLKNISGELLAIAYLPQEERNRALEDLNVIIGSYPDSDISQEQKTLLQEIIDELIKENASQEGNVPKAVSKPKAPKKPLGQIEVVKPEIVQQEQEKSESQPISATTPQPKTEIVQPELSIEDIEDVF